MQGFNRQYLRLPRHDSDAILTSLKLLVSDERPDVDGHFDTAVLTGFHGNQTRAQ